MMNLLLITLMSFSNATEPEELSIQDESQIERIELGLIEDSEDYVESTEKRGAFSEYGAYNFELEDQNESN